MADQLMVLCPKCDQWFASAIQMDPPTWEGIRMNDGMVERCSHCGHATRFSKDDYLFKSQDE